MASKVVVWVVENRGVVVQDCCGFMFSVAELFLLRSGLPDFHHHKHCSLYPKSELQQQKELARRRVELLGQDGDK